MLLSSSTVQVSLDQTERRFNSEAKHVEDPAHGLGVTFWFSSLPQLSWPPESMPMSSVGYWEVIVFNPVVHFIVKSRGT